MNTKCVIIVMDMALPYREDKVIGVQNVVIQI